MDDEEQTAAPASKVGWRRVSLLALIPVVLFASLAHVFGGPPVALASAGAVGAGGVSYAAWRNRGVRKTARPAGRMRRKERRTITRTRPVRSGRSRMPSLSRRSKGGAGRGGGKGMSFGGASRRKGMASKGMSSKGGARSGSAARRGGAGTGKGAGRSLLHRKPGSSSAGRPGKPKSGLGRPFRGKPGGRSAGRPGGKLGGKPGGKLGGKSGGKGRSGSVSRSKRGGASGGIMRRHRPNGSAGRRQRPSSPIRRQRPGGSSPGRSGAQARRTARRHGLGRLVPPGMRRKSQRTPPGTKAASPASRKRRPGTVPRTSAAARNPVSRRRRTAAQRAALRKANRRPPLTRRQQLAQRLRRTRPAGRGMFARSLRHPIKPQRLTPQQRRARQARIRQRRALLHRGWHPRQWRTPRHRQVPVSLARRIPDRFRRTHRAAARFDQWRLGRWLSSRRFRARRPALSPVPPVPLGSQPVKRETTAGPGFTAKPGPRVQQTESTSPAPAGTSSGGAMPFSSRIAAIAETAHEQIGSWEPGGGQDVEQALASLPELCEQLAQAIGSIGAKMGEGPFEQSATEAFTEAASRFAGLGDEFEHAHQVFRTEHADELKRLEEPRQQEQMWDTDKQEVGA